MTDSIIFTELAGCCQRLPTVLLRCVQVYVGRDVSLANLDLSGKDRQGADFARTTLSNSNFSNSNLAKSTFTNAVLENVSFLDSNLSGSSMMFATLSNAVFACRGAASPQCLFGVSFYGAILTDAQFPGLTMVSVDCRRALLSGADLTEANLHSVTMCDASMVDAILVGATLRVVDLTGVDLEGADFRGASLEATDLTRAIVHGIKMADATVRLAHDSVVTLAHYLHNVQP